MSLPDFQTSIIHYNEVPAYCLGGNILDVGSSNGYGAFHSVHKAHFLENNYLGIDIQNFDKCFLPVVNDDIFEFSTDTRFDTILILHTIEHIEIERWFALFTRLQELLAPRGYLVVNVPFRELYHPETHEHMVHEVFNIDEKLLSKFCSFNSFRRIRKERIYFRQEGERFVWAILRFLKRILTHHRYSILRTAFRRPVRLVAIFQQKK
jgi:hypothetical protein